MPTAAAPISSAGQRRPEHARHVHERVIERDGAGQVVRPDQFGDVCLPRRHVEGEGRPLHQRQQEDVPDLDDAGQQQRRADGAEQPISAWVPSRIVRRGKRSAATPPTSASASIGRPQPRPIRPSAVAEPES